MPKAKDVNNLLSELHERKIVNLDSNLRSVLQTSSALDQLDPGSEVAAAVIAWDGYGLVIKSQSATIDQVASLAQGIRQQLGARKANPEGEV